MQANGRKAMADAIRQVEHVIRFHVSRYPPDMADDLEQEGGLAAIKAWQTFDPSKGSAWPTWATRRIVGALQDYCRKHGREQPAESWEQIPEYEQESAVAVTALSCSNNPTVQKQIRIQADTWDAVVFLAKRKGGKPEPSVVIQHALEAWIKYQEKMLARTGGF